MDQKKRAEQIFRTILKTVNPREFLPDLIHWDQDFKTLTVKNKSFVIDENRKIFVIGTGKASPTMAAAMEDILGSKIEGGFIIAPPDTNISLSIIKMMKGSHPLPDSKSKKASDKLISFIQKIPDQSLVINLLSGGTSALLCKPADELDIADIHRVYSLLIESGADIYEVNTVRKALSVVKGGRLLSFFNNITLLDLVISDVPNDELASIGSGPTTPQEISFDKAFKVLKKYFIWNDLPHGIRNHLAQNMDKETKEGQVFITPDIKNHHGWIVSSASQVAGKTKKLLEEEGYKTILFHPAWSGLINEFEKYLMIKLRDALEDKTKKKALVFYGEPTVKVTGDGIGGRNQEIALRIAKRLNDLEQSITFLSAGTDGIDGPTDAAGAVVDQDTYKKARKNNLEPDNFVNQNDSYHFFEKAEGHIKTGPTGNNVMDIQFFLIDD